MLPFRSSFIKLPRHKQFNYKPRFYRPEEESLLSRLEKKEQAPLLAEKWRQKQVSQKSGNIRIALFLAVLTLLVYLILR